MKPQDPIRYYQTESMEQFNPFTKNWNKWPESTVKFFFSQAEAKLKQLIEAGRRITDRANMLLTTTTTLLLVILGYILKTIVDGDGLRILLVIAGVDAFILFAVIVMLLRLMFPRKVMPIGRDPRELITESFLHEKYSDEDITIAVILTECQSYQECIEFNEKDNNQRLKSLKIALYTLMSILPISLIIAFLYLWMVA
jgi:hypothetical protein